MTIRPVSELTLAHDAYHVAIGEAGHVAALSRSGAGSLIAPDQQTISNLHVGCQPKDVSVSATGEMIVVTGGQGLILLSISNPGASEQLAGGFESACFGAGDLLWTCARQDRETVLLEVREPATYMPIARATVADPFGDSGFDLSPLPDQAGVTLWAAAGQDGQCLFWAHQAGESVTVERFPPLEETTTASFSPNGQEFLVLSSGELHRYRYPHGPQTGRMEWNVDEAGDDLGDFISYVDANRALVQSINGRLYLIDLATMSVAEELRLQGHEPQPLAEVYPALAAEGGLCSDLFYFLPLPGSRFLSVHSESPSRRVERHDHVLTWTIPVGS